MTSSSPVALAESATLTGLPRVLGIDIALDKTGIAAASGVTWTSKGGKGDERLHRLYMDILGAGREADAAIIEDLPTHAMSAGLTGRAQGVARMALWKLGIPYVTVSPATLKKWATGVGNAKKPAMIARAKDIAANTLGVSHWEPTDDEADAYLLRVLGITRLTGGALEAKVKWDSWIDAGWLE